MKRVSSKVNSKCFCERSRAVDMATFLLHLTECIRKAVENSVEKNVNSVQ